MTEVSFLGELFL